jgi:hypothetical protein
VLRYEISQSEPSEIFKFKLYSLTIENDEPKEELRELKAVCGPGDEGESVITIMNPDEN